MADSPESEHTLHQQDYPPTEGSPEMEEGERREEQTRPSEEGEKTEKEGDQAQSSELPPPKEEEEEVKQTQPPKEKESAGGKAQSSELPPPKEEEEEVKQTQPPKEKESAGEQTQSSEPSPPKDPVQSSQLPPPASVSGVTKARYEWYQTQENVVVNLMIKAVKKENLEVEFSERTVSVSIKMSSGSDYCLELDLSHPIVPAKCRIKVFSTKVELRMRKRDGIQWTSLEGKGEPLKIKQPLVASGGGGDAVHKYPSSSHYTRNWDQLVSEIKAEEKDEKVEGDAALNKLFQQIYHDGSDEVRRAMNKSFMESGGTVLSTNWGEVGAKKVEIKPPDGMEWRQYET